MPLTAEPLSLRPRPDEPLDALFADGFPPWIASDREVKRYIGTVRDAFEDLELVMLDDDEIVAAGWGVPILWTGDSSDLPDGYTDTLRRAVADLERGVAVDTFVIMAIQVHPERRGKRVAGELISALRCLAHDRGWARVIAPVRPTSKASYPTIDIERYMTWTRAGWNAARPVAPNAHSQRCVYPGVSAAIADDDRDG